MASSSGADASLLDSRAPIALPPPAWMWKPRSTLTPSEEEGGHAKKHSFFRGLGAFKWKRRFLFVSDHAFYYGKEKNKKDKTVPLSQVRRVALVSKESVIKAKAPKEYADFAWMVATAEKIILFCAEDGQTMQLWANFFHKWIHRLPTPPPTPAAPVLPPPPPPVEAEQQQQQQSPPRSTPLPQDAPSTALETASAPPPPLIATEEAQAHPAPKGSAMPEPKPQEGKAEMAASVVRGMDEGTGPLGAARPPPHSTPSSRPIGSGSSVSSASNSSSSSSSSNSTGSSSEGDNSEDDEGEGGAAMAKLTSGADAASLPHLSYADEDEDDEGEDGDEEAKNAMPLSEQQQTLLAIATQPHSHAPQRVAALAGHFKKGDGILDVVYSRLVEKVNRKEHFKPRVLIITKRYVYIFSKKKKKRLTSSKGIDLRCFATEHVVGVRESVSEETLLALLVPHFHDILFRFVPHESPLGDRTCAELKRELTAHLFGIYYRYHRPVLHRPFLVLSTAGGLDIRATLRRSVEETFLPLRAEPASNDRMQIATRGGLLPLLYGCADVQVVWSSPVNCYFVGAAPTPLSTNEEGVNTMVLPLFVTNSAIYTASRDCSAVRTRLPLDTLLNIYIDMAEHHMLFKSSLHYRGERRARGAAEGNNNNNNAAAAAGAAVPLDRCTSQLFHVESREALEQLVALLAPWVMREAHRQVVVEPLARSAQLDLHKRIQSASRNAALLEVRESLLVRGVTSLGNDSFIPTDATATTSSGGGGGGGFSTDSSASGKKKGGMRWSTVRKEATKYLARFNKGNTKSDKLKLIPVDGKDASGAADDGAAPHGEEKNAGDARYVEEVLLDYNDVARILQDAEKSFSTWDQLQLASLVQTYKMRVGPGLGNVLLSTECRRWSQKEVSYLSKWEPSSSSSSNSGGGAAGGGASSVKYISQLKAKTASYGDPCLFLLGTQGLALVLNTSEEQLRKRLTTSTATAHRSSTTKRTSKASKDKEDADSKEAAAAGPLLQLDVVVPWAALTALVRGRQGHGSWLAILITPGEGRTADVLLDFRSEQALQPCILAAVAACRAYSGAPRLLDLYTVPFPGQLARAMRKPTHHDGNNNADADAAADFPTIALRYTPSSRASDWFRLAVHPSVANLCRAYGDNTLYFTGLAWRMRSETVRRQNGLVRADPGAAMCRVNNHLFKSFILAVTNNAIYYFTKGKYDLVRRTQLLDIRDVYVSTTDADTLLLRVPTEHDVYLRAPGRGRDLLQRVQEAYIEWTDYWWVRPHERIEAHNPEDYFVHVHHVEVVAPHGRLMKMPDFNAMQASRDPAACTEKMRHWHLRHVTQALRLYQTAAHVASVGTIASSSPLFLFLQHADAQHGGGGAGAATKRAKSFRARLKKHQQQTERHDTDSAPITWEQAKQFLEETQTYLYFTHRRAFRFGLRGAAFPVLKGAEDILERFIKIQAMTTAVLQAAEELQESTIDHFGALLHQMKPYEELNLLRTAQVSRYETMRQRQDALLCITRRLEARTAQEPPPNKYSLAELFQRADEKGVPLDILWNLRCGLDADRQQSVLQIRLEAYDAAAALRTSAMRPHQLASLLAAAVDQLELSHPAPSLTMALHLTISNKMKRGLEDEDENGMEGLYGDKKVVALLQGALWWAASKGEGPVPSALFLRCGKVQLDRLKQKLKGPPPPPADTAACITKMVDGLDEDLHALEEQGRVQESTTAEKKKVEELGRFMKHVLDEVNTTFYEIYTRRSDPSSRSSLSAPVAERSQPLKEQLLQHMEMCNHLIAAAAKRQQQQQQQQQQRPSRTPLLLASTANDMPGKEQHEALSTQAVDRSARPPGSGGAAITRLELYQRVLAQLHDFVEEQRVWQQREEVAQEEYEQQLRETHRREVQLIENQQKQNAVERESRWAHFLELWKARARKLRESYDQIVEEEKARVHRENAMHQNERESALEDEEEDDEVHHNRSREMRVVAEQAHVNKTRFRQIIKQCVLFQREIKEGTEHFRKEIQEEKEVLEDERHRFADDPAPCPELEERESQDLHTLLAELQHLADLTQATLARSDAQQAQQQQEQQQQQQRKPGTPNAEKKEQDGAPLRAGEIPAELATLVRAQDAEGVARYIMRDEQGLSAETLQAVKREWHREEAKRGRVQHLRQSLRAAMQQRQEALTEVLLVQLRRLSEANEADAATTSILAEAEALLVRWQQSSSSTPSVSEKDEDKKEVEIPQQSKEEEPTEGTAVQDDGAIVLDETPLRVVEQPKGKSNSVDSAVVLGNDDSPVAASHGEDAPTTRTSAAPYDDLSLSPSASPPRAEHQGKKKVAIQQMMDALRPYEAQMTAQGTAPAEEGTGEGQEARQLVQRMYQEMSCLLAFPSTQLTRGDPAKGAEWLFYIDFSNPSVLPFFQLWLALLTHRLKPIGFFRRTPRTLFALFKDAGEVITSDGTLLAPHMGRLARDTERFFALHAPNPTTGKDGKKKEAERELGPTEERERDAMMLMFMFKGKMLERTLKDVLSLGEEERRRLVLEDAALAQPQSLSFLASAAHFCDTSLTFSVFDPSHPGSAAERQQLLAFLVQPAGTRLSTARASAPALPPAEAPVGERYPEEGGGKQEAHERNGSVKSPSPAPPASASATYDTSHNNSNNNNNNRIHAAGVLAAVSPQQLCVSALKESVQLLTKCFAYHVAQRKENETEPATASDGGQLAYHLVFDERRNPVVGTVVMGALVPSLVQLLRCGFIERYALVRRRHPFDFIQRADEFLREQETMGSKAQQSLHAVLEFVEALTQLSDPRSRKRNANVEQGVVSFYRLTPAQQRALFLVKEKDWKEEEVLQEIKLRLFLVECMNRRVLSDVLFGCLFPPCGSNPEWLPPPGRSDGLWEYYEPSACIFYQGYRMDLPAATPMEGKQLADEIRGVVQKIARIPFVLRQVRNDFFLPTI